MLLNTWEKVQTGYKKYLCQGDQAFYEVGQGYSIFSIGYEDVTSNFIFINESINNSDFLKLAKFNSFIISTVESRDKIAEFAKEEKITFLSTQVVMSKYFSDESFSAPINENIKVLMIQENLNIIDDFIFLRHTINNVPIKDLKKSYNKKTMNTNDVNIYIAYIDDKPVAYLSCALLDKNAILLSTIVLKEYREKGVINAFIKEIIKKAREVGIEYYTSIIMSPQIQKKFEEQGCITEFLCDLWYYNK